MIEQTENKMVYVVNDNPVFAFNIRFFEIEDIQAFLETEDDVFRKLTPGVDFTVEQKDDYSDGANVTLRIGTANVPVMPKGKKFTVMRQLPVVQKTSLPEYGKLPSKPLETQLDKIIMICQQFAEEIARAITVAPGSEITAESFLKSVNVERKGAEAAKQGAEAAKQGAEAAKQGAEAAKQGAEAAKQGAEEAARMAGKSSVSVVGDTLVLTGIEYSVNNGVLSITIL